MKKGFFVTLEGPDGCGKTTQSKLLAQALRERRCAVVHTREPGGTSFAENLRRILLNPEFKILPLTELILYEASRAQHTEEVIRPALNSGKIVLCERYTDATHAYQGYGRKIPVSTIKKLNQIATRGLLPDLTIVLDIPVEVGLKRARGASPRPFPKEKKRVKRGDRLEQENAAFHNRVRKGYFELAKKATRRIKIISALGSVGEVHQRVMKMVLARLYQ